MIGKTKKKVISGILAAIMAAAYVPTFGASAYADTEEDAAKAALDAANIAVTETKAAYDKAESEYETAVKEKEDADKKVTDAQIAVTKAEQAAESAVAKVKNDTKSDADAKKAKTETAKTAYDTAKSNYESAKSAYEATAAGYDISKLNQDVTDASTTVASCETALQNAKSAQNTAQAAYDNAGRTFINEKAGSSLSVEMITDLYKNNSALSRYAGTAKYSNALASALTVDNLNKAADLVSQCNDLRSGHGLAALKINYRLMCFSATSAAVSSQVSAHAALNQLYDDAFPELIGILPYYPSENLAWSYSDPFAGWYTSEKKKFEEYVASGEYPNLANMSAYDIHEKYPTLYSQTGHYLNIIDPDVTITGFARSTAAGTTYEQAFSSGTSFGENVTPADFKSALANYTATPKAALDSAKQATQTAQTNLDTAKSAETAAKKALSDATTDINNKKAVMDAAKTKADSAEASLQTANTELMQANAAAAKANAIDLTNPSSYSDFPSIITAVQNQKKAEEDLEAAKKEAKTAEDVVAEKKTEMDEAKGKYDTAVADQKKAEAEYEKYQGAKKSIEEAVVYGVKDMTYTGYPITQSLVVTLDGKELLLSDYYAVYENNTNVGTASIIISGKGDYAGYVTETFVIHPMETDFLKVKKGKKSFTAKWNMQTEQVDGYQIQYSTKKNFKKGKKTVTIKSNAITSKKIKKLKAKKKYFVRIRTYKTNDVRYFSAWSVAKSIKTR